jgi:hypothetical protein
VAERGVDLRGVAERGVDLRGVAERGVAERGVALRRVTLRGVARGPEPGRPAGAAAQRQCNTNTASLVCDPQLVTRFNLGRLPGIGWHYFKPGDLVVQQHANLGKNITKTSVVQQLLVSCQP